MRRASRWFAPAWLLGLLLCCSALGHAQGKAEDVPLPDDPPVPSLSTPAPRATVAPVSQGSTSADDIPLPDDPAVPSSEAPATAHDHTGHQPKASSSENDIPLPTDPSVPSTAPQDAGNASAPDPAPVPVDNSGLPDFLKQALFAGIVVAALNSYLGLFVVARRLVFVGLALSEISSAGIALGVLLHLEHGREPLLFALGFMLLGVLLFSRRWAPRRVPIEAVIGGFYCLATALGILLIAKSAQGETHVLTLLQGDVLAVYPEETLEMAAVFVALGILHAVFAKEFLLVSLDRDTASTMGFKAPLWDFLLVLTIGIAVSLSIRSVGVLMATSLLILPAATALLLAPRWNRAALTAPVVGVLAVMVGLWLSYKADFPASAVTVAVLFAFFFPALLWHSLRRS